MAKAKTLLTVQAFQATPSVQPPIPDPKIAPIDQGSLFRIPDNIQEEPLPNPTPEFTIDEDMKLIIYALQKDKGKKPMTTLHSIPPLK